MSRATETTEVRKVGHYFGTEIDEKWWKRYRKEKMFARGTGTYWYDQEAFYFLRYLTKTPIKIPFENVVGLKTGRWHAGQWGTGRAVIKIVWERNGLKLSSGFIVSKDKKETQRLMAELGKRAEAAGVQRH